MLPWHERWPLNSNFNQFTSSEAISQTTYLTAYYQISAFRKQNKYKVSGTQLHKMNPDLLT
jgi:hypothetical protein